MSIISQSPVDDSAANEQDAQETTKPANPPSLAIFLEGSIWCDTRGVVRDRVIQNIERQRKSACSLKGTSLPEQIHLRTLDVATDGIFIIAIEDPCALPEFIRREDAVNHVIMGDWVPIDEEPVLVARLTDASLSAAARRRRDADWDLIRPVHELGSKQFDPKLRGPVIAEMGSAKRLSHSAIYRRLRRYWQGGRQKNAMVGRWFHRNKRRGRGSILLTRLEVKNGQKPVALGGKRADGKPSFHVHAVNRELILKGARDYLYTPRGGSAKIAWLKTIARDFLPKLHSLSPEQISDRLRTVSPDQYPSLRTFRYWIADDPALKGRLISRWGERTVNLKYRRLVGRTENSVSGPGSAFQIDATKGDIVLVHRVTRRPIGRAVIYLVVDCWSHMVVGYYIYLKNAGYDPAALALLGTAEDKVALCGKFGIGISETEWPVACLPEELIADSELASTRAHALVERRLINSLSITPAYRADLKGLVESMHGALTKSTLTHLDGYSTGARKRATVNPAAEAVLDYFQLNQIVIRWILQTNRRILPDCAVTEPMLKDPGFKANTPLNRWIWGTENVSGKRRKWDATLLKLLLLPRGKARVTRRGIEFDHLVYEPVDSEFPEFANWTVEAAAKGSWNEEIIYHPDRVVEAWLCHEDRLIRLKLVGSTQERATWAWADHVHDQQERSIKHSMQASADLPEIAFHEGEKERILREGAALTTNMRGTVAKRRLEKVDVETERTDQQHLIDGRKTPPVEAVSMAAPNKMAHDDERATCERLQMLTRGTAP